MDGEFHYWMTGIIARGAGFTEDEAKTIAYCAEYVDENDVSIEVLRRDTGKVDYSNYISQTMNILKPKQQLMRIYPIFHFVPGEPDAVPARRRDGKMHLLNTTPNSENANALMDAAFKAPEDIRLYRIGIASHMYADTWAHQNFVGWYDYFNDVGFDLKPNIGHADGEHHPDWPGHRWTDVRLVDGDIDNNDRFLSAAECMYGKYRGYLAQQGRDAIESWESLEEKLGYAMGRPTSGDFNWGKDERMAEYKKLAGWLKEFDELEWFDDAIETDVRGLRDSADGIGAKFTVFRDKFYWREDRDKEKTDWFRFQEAVKDHEKTAIKQLKKTFKMIRVDISRA